MSTTAVHRISRLMVFGGVCVVFAATTLFLTACGGISSTHPAKSQTARATPAQSGADVGTAAVQTTTGQRTGSSRGGATAATARGRHGAPPHHASTVTGAGAKVTHAGTVVAARQTPTASNDDNNQGGSAHTFNPCALVTLSEAQSITGGTVLGRAEAPLGPTCIYKHRGTPQEITLAIEGLEFAQATHHLARKQGVVVNGRKGYCGGLGTQMLFVQLPANQTLNVVAPCGVAQRFAATAVTRLRAKGWIVKS